MDHEWRDRVDGMSIEKQWKTLYNEKLKIRKPHESIWSSGNFLRNSKELRNLLQDIIKDLEIKSFVDVGCSDLKWMQKLNLTEFNYLGIDIVKKMIEKNIENYPELKFEHRNIIEDKCPKADMIFMRSVLIHMPLKECLTIIENIKSSGSKYTMISTKPDINKNLNTSCLFLSQRNLQIKPFNLPEPMFLVPEMVRDDEMNNYMGVWKIEDLNKTV